MHHTAVSVRRFDDMLGFYTAAFGGHPIDRNEWDANPVADAVLGVKGSSVRKVTLRIGNSFLELFEFRHPLADNPPLTPYDKGYTHIALLVEDIDREVARIAALGASFHCAVQQFGAARSVYGMDPEDNIFELIEVLDSRHPYVGGQGSGPQPGGDSAEADSGP
ncbi:MAG: VOC family protein [Parahaliea sp.]